MVGLLVAGASLAVAQSSGVPSGPNQLARIGADQRQALQVHPSIHLALGFGNSFLVTTPDGNVVIDTSLPVHARRHVKLFSEVSDAPLRAIILTHGHGDHRGGVPIWLEGREPGTVDVIAQRNYAEFLHYQTRLSGFFARRNAAQFGAALARELPDEAASPGNYAAEIDATVLFDDRYDFELGGVAFEVHHAPGETYDHLAVWIPAWKAAFVGDNFYGSFPNIYTLRGTQPRWALDYVASLDKVLSWRPELVLPSHGMPIAGWENVERELTRYRDAIVAVHDAVVAGMNRGDSVFELMRSIELPEGLEVGEGYGNLPWSVRGIYEGYVGWYDGQAASLYAVPRAAVSDDLVELAGGPESLAKRARTLIGAGAPLEALQLLDVALEASPTHRPSLELRLEVLTVLDAASVNSNEKGWLQFAIADTQARLGASR
jgi:alkyl sulfatase BDS1-like metallo-beta-lactamase superfamily hydrolase